MESMKSRHTFILSIFGLIFSVVPIFANENSHDYPTHRRNQDESTAKLWIPPNDRGSWTIMENVSQPTNDPDPNVEQNIVDESRVLPKRRIVDSTREEDPILLLAETDPADSLTSIRNQLQNRFCQAEAFKFGYDREIGATVHEILCEMDKLLRYAWITAQNLMYELGLDELFDPEGQEKRIISLNRLLSDKTLFEVVEYYLMRFRTFLTNPEYLEYLSIVVENSVPIAEIRETCDRLEIAIDNLVDRVAKIVESHLHLRIGADGADMDVANQLREEIVAGKEDALRCIREHLANRIEEKQFQKMVSFVESLFDQFLDREPFYRYLAVLKEITDILRDFYHGFRASSF